MNPIRTLRYKTRIGFLLAGLLGCLLVNNLIGQDSYDEIRRNAKSIYEDRLMPSTFIFDLREHLYQEQALLASPHRQDPELLRQREVHQLAIAGLIARYEQTELTREERREWSRFRQHLSRFHGSPVLNNGFNADLEQSLTCLNHLNAIQAGVAKDLESKLATAASASSIRSYFEIVLLIVIGTVTLSLIGYSRNALQKTVSHRPSLN